MAWKRNLYLIWCTQILSMMGFGFVLPFIPFYIQELGVTDPAELKAWTGAISSAPGILMGVMAPVWGLIADRFGRKLMLLRAMFSGFVIMGAIGLARNVEIVFALRTVQGMFTGTIAAAAALVASGTPKDRLSYALGLLASSTFIGYAMGPAVGGLCAEWLGYRTTFFIGSAMLLVGFFLVLFFIREKTPGISPEIDDGPDQQKFDSRTDLKKPYLPLLIIFLFLRFSRSLPFSFIPIYIQELRGTVEGASAITGAVSAAAGIMAALSGLTLARLGDRYNRIKLVGVFVGLAAVTALPIAFIPTIWGFLVFYMMASFFLGPTSPFLESYLSSMTSARSRGMLFGVQAFVTSVGWFLAPLTGSAIAISLGTGKIFLFFSGALGLTLLIVAVPIIRSRLRVQRPLRQDP